MGYFIDERDGQRYRTVKIGGAVWMAENLNCADVAADSWAYSDGTYGRLYTLDAAVDACPDGWRLPTIADWDNLAKAVGERDIYAKLRARKGWEKGSYSAGTDNYRFSALPGGCCTADGTLEGVCEKAFWWAKTDETYGDNCVELCSYGWHKCRRKPEEGFSVRCIQSEEQSDEVETKARKGGAFDLFDFMFGHLPKQARIELEAYFEYIKKKYRV